MSSQEVSLFSHDERLRGCYSQITEAQSAFRRLGQCYNSDNHEAYEYQWSQVMKTLSAAKGILEELMIDGTRL